MGTKKQLLYELMCAATHEGVSVRDFVLEDPTAVELEPTIAATTVVCGVKAELFYGQAGDERMLWLARGVKCLDLVAAKAAIEAYEEMPLGQKFSVENEVGGDEDGLLLADSFPNGSEEENIAALQGIFSLFTDPASEEKLSAPLQCFAE